MRSDLVFGATAHVPNRYQLTKLVSVATRALHRPGTRIQDTMNDVLVRFSRSSAIASIKGEQYPVTDRLHPTGAHQRKDSRDRSGHQRKLSSLIIDTDSSVRLQNNLAEVELTLMRAIPSTTKIAEDQPSRIGIVGSNRLSNSL